MTEITQADIEAVIDEDALALADEIVLNSHGNGNAAVLINELVTRHRMEERAAIVAWLHEQWVNDATDSIDVFDMIDGIKAGEHLK